MLSEALVIYCLVWSLLFAHFNIRGSCYMGLVKLPATYTAEVYSCIIIFFCDFSKSGKKSKRSVLWVNCDNFGKNTTWIPKNNAAWGTEASQVPYWVDLCWIHVLCFSVCICSACRKVDSWLQLITRFVRSRLTLPSWCHMQLFVKKAYVKLKSCILG